MTMNSLAHTRMPVEDSSAYTDLQSLQKLRNTEDKDAALKQVAQQFESMFLNMLLKNMRQANAVFEEGSLFSSSETRFVRDMYDQQLSLDMASSSSTGLADALYRQLSGRYGESASVEKQAPNTRANADDWAARRRVVMDPMEVNTEEKTGPDSVSRVPLADDPREFLKQIMPYAERAARLLGAEPEVLAAQAALETGWGRYVLADGAGNSSHNLFNIKADSDWQGGRVSMDALEYRDGVAVREQSQFKRYRSLAESFEDFAHLLTSQSRYAPAVENAGDATAFVNALKDGGYATDPQYADKVLSVYREIQAAQDNGPNDQG